MTERQRLGARLAGRVQGVGFRYWAVRHADSLGLVGWVMNRNEENELEVVAEGDPLALDAFERLLRSGPPGSRIERFEVSRSPASGEFTRFAITRP